MKKFLLLFSFIIVMTGCCHQKFELGNTRKSVPTYEGTTNFIFWGIGQEKSIDPYEVCGRNGVNAVETGVNFWNGVAAALTWGIYQPYEYKIYCNSTNMGRGMSRTMNGMSPSANYQRYDNYGY